MANRPSLADNLYKAANPNVELEEGTDKPTPKKPVKTDNERHYYITPRRIGQKVIGTYVSPEVHRQLKLLAMDEGVTGEMLMYEAINDLFRKYGKPPIAVKPGLDEREGPEDC